VLIAGVMGLDNGLGRTPPMGWLSWQRFRCEIDCYKYSTGCISERLYTDMADRMVADGYLAAGYQYVNVDDCWPDYNQGRGTDGKIKADPIRFPHGMKWLGDYIHSKGLKYGIYTDIAGKTCDGYEGSGGHFDIDAQTFAEWGVDSLKVDGCNGDTSKYGQLYPQFGQSLNKTGRPILYACSWPAYIIGHADFVEIAKSCNLWRPYDDIQDDYGSMSHIADWWATNQDKLIPAAKPGAWNDPDMLIIGDFALSIDEAKAQMAIWAILAAPLLMSNDLRAIRPEYKDILLNREVIAVNQDPAGKQGRLVKNKDQIEWWVRTLNDSSVAVAIWIRSSDYGFPQKVTTIFSELGLGWARARIRDVFNHLDLGVAVGAFVSVVNPHGVILYKLTQA